VPFAIGTTTLAPGALITPGTVFTFTMAPGPGGTPTNATRYIQRALAQGQLGFVLAPLLPASGSFGGGEGGDYLFFTLSENGVSAPTLRIELSSPAPACVGDIDCATGTSAADFTVLASNFGAVGVGRAQGDLNGDGAVNAADFTLLASDFGCVP
jgi:hypothetical protein